MVDILTRRVIDIIETRDTQAVTEWLMTFPSLRYVSRDGSITYKKAITQANENIIQISDRFHLLKGLTDAAKKFITGCFKANINLSVSNSHNDSSTKTGTYWVKIGDNYIPTKIQDCASERKRKIVAEARSLYNEGYAIRKIAERLGVTFVTVKRYLLLSSGQGSSCQDDGLVSYVSEIRQLLAKGKTFNEIQRIVRQIGYKGPASVIRMFITHERSLYKKKYRCSTERIERKRLVSLLYKPIHEVKDISQEQLDKIIERKPIIGKLYDTVKSFKEVLFSKNTSKLDGWLKDALSLGLDEITTFVNGINRDIEAVRNAIKYDYNNGLAEGSVNKLKVIKRIMYGRCAFYLLKNKLLHLENRR